MMLCAETTAARTTVSNADECMVKCVLECEVGRFSVTRESFLMSKLSCGSLFASDGSFNAQRVSASC